MKEILCLAAAGFIGFVIGREMPPAAEPVPAPVNDNRGQPRPGRPLQQCPDGRCPPGYQPAPGYQFSPTQMEMFPPTIRP